MEGSTKGPEQRKKNTSRYITQKFQGIRHAEKTLETSGERENNSYPRISSENHIIFLNGNTESKKAMKQLFQNTEAKLLLI